MDWHIKAIAFLAGGLMAVAVHAVTRINASQISNWGCEAVTCLSWEQAISLCQADQIEEPGSYITITRFPLKYPDGHTEWSQFAEIAPESFWDYSGNPVPEKRCRCRQLYTIDDRDSLEKPCTF